MLLKSQKILKKIKSKLYNNKKASYKISKMKKVSKRIATRTIKRNIKGGGNIELNNKEIDIFIKYLMTNDKEFITKCSQFGTNTNNTNNSTTMVLIKIFGNNKIDCERFALNILGKVSVLKGLYDYAHKLNKSTKKKENELKPEEIDEISKSMEHRCDNSSYKNNVSLETQTKVKNIIEWVYSPENIKKTLEKLQKDTTDTIEQLSNTTEKTTEIIELIDDFTKMNNNLEQLNENPSIFDGLSYNIKKITSSYFGYNNDNCEESIKLMGLIKALSAIIKLYQKSQLSHSNIDQIIQKVLGNINPQTQQGGYPKYYGNDVSTYEKIQKLLSKPLQNRAYNITRSTIELLGLDVFIITLALPFIFETAYYVIVSPILLIKASLFGINKIYKGINKIYKRIKEYYTDYKIYEEYIKSLKEEEKQRKQNKKFANNVFNKMKKRNEREKREQEEQEKRERDQRKKNEQTGYMTVNGNTTAE